jgi:CarD family transcriptional regulator
MKKINLKNILKRTFKNKKKSLNKNKKKGKASKASKEFKVTKVGKKNKKIRKTIKPKIKTSIKNEKITKKENKVDNLRIPKSNELKPEIKKIKKQETEKKEYKPKDYVVYPKHGVGQILAISSKTIGEIEVQCYEVKFEKDKATGLLPINKQVYLRPLSTINQVNKSIYILKSKPKIKRTMWSRRAQEYEQKINSGKLYELTEVVRDLNKKTDIIAEQSYSERQLFEKAYDRLKTEFEVVLGEKAQLKIDKALKRETVVLQKTTT